MNYDSETKKKYSPPELEFVLYNTEDALVGSGFDNFELNWNNVGLWEDGDGFNGGDANTDHNDIGNGFDLSDNEIDSDISNDDYYAGDGSDLY